MFNNKGCEVEFAMKRWFKGTHHPADHVDFQTNKSLYEVKSCNFFNKCLSKGRVKGTYDSTQMGRFYIRNENHKSLLFTSKEENKIPRYVFVMRIGKQYVWRTKSWGFVDKLIVKRNKQTLIRIKDVFGGECQ